MKRIIYSPSSIVKIPNIFGTGTDGDVTISTTVTLTSDKYYRNLSIGTGGKIITNGFRIYVYNSLVNNGTIACDGGNGVLSSPGAIAYDLASFTSNPGAGAAGSSTVGNGATNGTWGNNYNDTNCIGGPGGSVTGGNGGNGSNPLVSTGGEDIVRYMQNFVTVSQGYFIPQAFIGGSQFYLSGGAGGGAGGVGTGAVGTSGAGGAGGGSILLCAKYIRNNGTIRALGGHGGNAQGTGNIGGGGGGGGGAIVMIGLQISGNAAVVTGGTAGTGVGTQLVAAQNGADGFVKIITDIV